MIARDDPGKICIYAFFCGGPYLVLERYISRRMVLTIVRTPYISVHSTMF